MSNPENTPAYGPATLEKVTEENRDKLAKILGKDAVARIGDEQVNGVIDNINNLASGDVWSDEYKKGLIKEGISEAKTSVESRKNNRRKFSIGRLSDTYLVGVASRANKRASKDLKTAQKLERKEGETPEAHANRLKWHDRRSRLVVGIGVAAGASLFFATKGHNMFNAAEAHNASTQAPDIDLMSDDKPLDDKSAEFEKMLYGSPSGDDRSAEEKHLDFEKELYQPEVKAETFFDMPDTSTMYEQKQNINDFGPPSLGGLNGDKAFMMSDWSDMFRGNAGIMTSYLSEFNMGDAPVKPSDTALENPSTLQQYHADLAAYTEKLEKDPAQRKIVFDELMSTLDGSKVGELNHFEGPYSSWWVDHETGDIKYDTDVNYKDVPYRTITLADGREFKVNPNCRLQISDANPIPVYTPQVVSNPVYEGSGPAPVVYSTGPKNSYVPPAPIGSGPVPPNPGNPSNPGNPGNPSNPTNPGNPGTPTEPTTPSVLDKDPALSSRNNEGYNTNGGETFTVDENDYLNVDQTPTEEVRINPGLPEILNQVIGGDGGNVTLNTNTGGGNVITGGTTSGDLLSGGGVEAADPTTVTSGGNTTQTVPAQSAGAVGEG